MSTAGSRSGGLAVVCGLDGVITDVIRNDLGGEIGVGERFAGLTTGDGLAKAAMFFSKIRATGAAYDWELHLATANGYSTVQLAGCRKDDRILVLGSAAGEEISRLYEDLASINNEQVTQLRGLMKDRFRGASSPGRGVSAVYDDLTRLNNELAATQRELVKNNLQLERLNQQKNQFLGMAAHDLRNPLAIIETYSGFLLHDLGKRVGGEPLEFLETIRTSSQFMLRLVNDLLDISQIEAGDLVLERSHVDLNALVGRKIALNRVFANRKSIVIEWEPLDGLAPVEVDPTKLEQVLNNLLSNAVKYSNENTRVVVSLSREAGGLILAVKDQGQGIPADEMEKVFEPFQRTSVKTTAGESSTGLGLAICRRIVEGHGGSIRAESIEGEGTTFLFSLPVESGDRTGDVKDVAEAVPAGSDQCSPEDRDVARTLRILVAEDNAVGRKLVERVVKKLGHEVTLVENGREAVDAVQGTAFDEVLMDVEMPVMDGLEAASRIREIRPGLPVIALTAHTAAREADRCREAGMVSVVTKPLRPAELKSVLADVVNRETPKA